MTFYLWQPDAPVSIASNRRVLRASELPSFDQANALCDQLSTLAQEQPAKVAGELERARATGYARGLEEGKVAAREETAAQLTTMTSLLDEVRQQLRADTAALALAVVRKLMGRFSDADQLAGLADTAASEVIHGGEVKSALTLFVHPNNVDTVRERLASVAERDSNPRIDVRADPDCDTKTCRLDSELGTVEATLEVQLARLAKAWGVDAGVGGAVRAAAE